MPAAPTPSGAPGASAAGPAANTHRGKLILFLALILFGAGLLWWATRPSPEIAQKKVAEATFRTAKVTRGNLEQRLRVAGSSAARNYATMVAPRLRSGGDREINILKLAKSGSTVEKGSVVAELDPQTLKDRLDDEQASLKDVDNDVLKQKVAQELDMVNLQQNLRVAKSQLDKATLDMKATEVRTDVDRELLKLNAEEAAAQYKELQLDVPQKEASQRADARITEINRRLQKIKVDRVGEDIGRYTMTTPMSGMVVMQSSFRPGGDQVQIQEGDRLSPGQPFMKVVDPKTMQVEGSINQAESSQFRIGQPAIVKLDAFPDAVYQGKVYSIGALATGTRGQQYFIRNVPIRIQVLNPDGRMIPDLSASADVLIDKAENALLVPASAILAEGGKKYVEIRTPKGFEKREVTTGISNGTQVVIGSGVNEGDEVKVH